MRFDSSRSGPKWEACSVRIKGTAADNSIEHWKLFDKGAIKWQRR